MTENHYIRYTEPSLEAYALKFPASSIFKIMSSVDRVIYIDMRSNMKSQVGPNMIQVKQDLMHIMDGTYAAQICQLLTEDIMSDIELYSHSGWECDTWWISSCHIYCSSNLMTNERPITFIVNFYTRVQ
jgi:hypothetical protein